MWYYKLQIVFENSNSFSGTSIIMLLLKVKHSFYKYLSAVDDDVLGQCSNHDDINISSGKNRQTKKRLKDIITWYYFHCFPKIWELGDVSGVVAGARMLTRDNMSSQNVRPVSLLVLRLCNRKLMRCWVKGHHLERLWEFNNGCMHV